MIWTIPATLAAMVVSIIPAGALAYAAARTVSGFGTQKNARTVLLFAVVFAAAYVACAYALIAWWV